MNLTKKELETAVCNAKTANELHSIIKNALLTAKWQNK